MVGIFRRATWRRGPFGSVVRVAVFAGLLLCPAALAEDLSKVMKRCGPAVVVIRQADGEVLGSGVLVSADGVILTAEHLFDDDTEYTVELYKGEKLPVKRFLYRNAELDLAALEVAGKGLPSVEIADANKAQVGAGVVAIGNPEGFENTISQGVLSGKRALGDESFRLQTTAPISPGSSGGGLFDEQGRLLGILVSYYSSGQNLNFAIPATYADYGGLRALDRQIVAKPSEVDGYLKRAQAYFEVTEFELALVDLKQALQLDKQSESAYRLRGEIFWQQGRNEESLADFTTAARLNPKNPANYFDRAHTYRSMERYDDAVAEFQKSLELDSGYEDAYRGLAETYFWVGEYQKAAQAWTGAIKANPDEVSYLTYRGEAYFFAEDYEAAGDDFVAVIGKDPTWFEPYFYGGRMCLIASRYEDAVRLLDLAIDASPERASAHFYRGWAHSERQDYEKALSDIGKAIELGKDDADTRLVYGNVFYAVGRYDRAAVEYSKALEHDSSRLWYVCYRGDAYAAANDKKAAGADYRYVLDNSSDPELRKAARTGLDGLGK